MLYGDFTGAAASALGISVPRIYNSLIARNEERLITSIAQGIKDRIDGKGYTISNKWNSLPDKKKRELAERVFFACITEPENAKFERIINVYINFHFAEDIPLAFVHRLINDFEILRIRTCVFWLLLDGKMSMVKL